MVCSPNRSSTSLSKGARDALGLLRLEGRLVALLKVLLVPLGSVSNLIARFCVLLRRSLLKDLSHTSPFLWHFVWKHLAFQSV